MAAIGGYPVLVRPSYVLSGAAMRVAHSAPNYGSISTGDAVTPEHPVVVSKYERHAREIEFDAVAQDGKILRWAICEHIEDAGVHSGDATMMLPPQDLTVETVRKVRRIGAALLRAPEVTGPVNIQLLARGDEVKVIECNLRASRSFPLVSKALGCDYIAIATGAMLGSSEPLPPARDPLDLDYVVGESADVFVPATFGRRSAARRRDGGHRRGRLLRRYGGRGAGQGPAIDRLFAGRRGVLLSLGTMGDKYLLIDEARVLSKLGLQLYATAGTAETLHAEGIACEVVDKGEGGPESSALRRLRQGAIDLVINIPRSFDEQGRPDGFLIRRAAIDLEIPLLSDLQLARAVVKMLARVQPSVGAGPGSLRVLPWRAYLDRVP